MPDQHQSASAALRAIVATLVLLCTCAAPAFAGDPIPLTNVVCLVYGAEIEDETPRIGHVFVREDSAGYRLCFGDGDIPGGIPLARLDDIPPYQDPYNLTNTVKLNGNTLRLGPHYAIQAPRGLLSITYDSIQALRIAAATNAASGPALSYSYDAAHHVVTLAADYDPSADMSLVVSTNLLDASSWVPCTNAVVSYPDPLTIQWQVSSTNILGGASVYFFAIDSSAEGSAAARIHADLPLVAEQGLSLGGELRTEWTDLTSLSNSVAAVSDTLAAHATNAMVRLAQAMNQTCTLYWRSQDLATNDVSAFYFPTNFPTPRLKVFAWTYGMTNCVFELPAWNPGREVEIEFELGYSSDRGSDNTVALKMIGNNIYTRNTTSGLIWLLRYSPLSGRWISYVNTVSQTAQMQRNVAPDGSGGTSGSGSVSDDAPATVEQWLVSHPEWAAAMAAQPRSLSAPPQLSPALTQPSSDSLDTIDSLDSLENLVDQDGLGPQETMDGIEQEE